MHAGKGSGTPVKLPLPSALHWMRTSAGAVASYSVPSALSGYCAAEGK